MTAAISSSLDRIAPLGSCGGTYPKLTGWAEETIEETLAFHRLPRQHHEHLESRSMVERLNEEIRRRTHVGRIFPSAGNCVRLVRALAVEIHESRLEAYYYVNMEDLRGDEKEQLGRAA
jgi:transposase-like protein